MANEQLMEALVGVRQAFQADGADLSVERIEGDTAHVRLLMGPDACEECLLPKDLLERMILSQLQSTMPELARVELDDPRESE